ncbi:MAG TPA: CocE/NonD family hydrolase [Iamia sp.]
MRRRLLAVAVLLLVIAAVPGPPVAADDPPGTRLCDDTTVTMSDDVRLHTWVSRLAPDTPKPVLLEFESYNVPSNTCPTTLPSDGTSAYVDQSLVERFTLVHVSYRGSGSSEGLFDLTGPRTQADVDEVISWAAAQPWSDGRVVLTGQSGTGFAAHHGLSHPAVVAGVIYSSCADMYRCFRRGGVYNTLPEIYMARTEAGYAFGLPQRLAHGMALNPDPVSQQLALADAVLRTKTEARNTAWWQERSALDSLEDVTAPVLYTSDAYDIVSPYEAYLRTPDARLVLGFGHSTEALIAANPARHALLVRGAIDRFLQREVFGEAVPDDPEVLLLTNTGSTDSWRAGETYVRGEGAWPLPSTDWTELHLAAGPGGATSLNDGGLVSGVPATGSDVAPLLTSPDLRVDTRTTNWLLGDLLPGDIRAHEALGLTYTTPSLAEDMEVTGPITLRLVASTYAADLDWSVRLTDVHPDGRSEIISDGYLKATLRAVDPARSLTSGGLRVRPFHPLSTSSPVPGGQKVTYEIEIIPTSNIFAAGHRLRLDVLPIASGGLLSLPLPGLGTIRVHRGAEGSSLIVPVIPAGCSGSTPLRETDPARTCASSYADALS